MKKIGIFSFTIISIILAINCTQNREKKTKVDNRKVTIQTKSFDWLLGEWYRIDGEMEKKTYENWTKKNELEYNGVGFTLKNNDTLSREKIKLTKLEDSWILLVKGIKDSNPTQFTVTEIDNEHFVCENRQLDFPKKIEYWKDGDKLKAKVSGDEMEISFEFEKRTK